MLWPLPRQRTRTFFIRSFVRPVCPPSEPPEVFSSLRSDGVRIRCGYRRAVTKRRRRRVSVLNAPRITFSVRELEGGIKPS